MKTEVWLGAESNRRHVDFQSTALPTELPSRKIARQPLFQITGWSLCKIRAAEQQRSNYSVPLPLLIVLCSGQNRLTLACMSDQFLSELNLWCLSRQEAIAATGNADSPYFKLITPLQYRSTLLGGIIEIPKDFLTDLGSIPRAVWWWLSPDDYDISYPSVVHDYIYKQNGDLSSQQLPQKQVDRETADRVLREAMAAVGASNFRQGIVYNAVRTFGPRW